MRSRLNKRERLGFGGFWALVMLMFHTFTFAQSFFSFYVSVAMFALAYLALSIYERPNYQLMGAGVAALAVLCLHRFLFPSEDLTYVNVLGQFLPMILWPTLFFLMSKKSQKTYGIILTVFLIGLAISCFFTLKMLLEDPEASRLLAGYADDELRALYYSKGIGGYGFIYGLVLLSQELVVMQRQAGRRVKGLLRLLNILIGLTILFSGYTIALFLYLTLLITASTTRFQRKDALILLIAFLVLGVLFFNQVVALINGFARMLNLQWVLKRTQEVLEASVDSKGFAGLKRFGLYSASVRSFLTHPLAGSEEIGGHSLLLDILGRYGVFAMPMISYFIKLCRTFTEFFRNKLNSVVFILLIVFAVVDTLDAIVTIPMAFFALPLLILYNNGRSLINTGEEV